LLIEVVVVNAIALSIYALTQAALLADRPVSVGVELAPCGVHAYWVARHLLGSPRPFSAAEAALDVHRMSPDVSLEEIRVSAVASGVFAEAVWLRPGCELEIQYVAIVRIPIPGAEIRPLAGVGHYVVVSPRKGRWIVHDFPRTDVRVVDPVDWLYEIAVSQGQSIVEEPEVPALLLALPHHKAVAVESPHSPDASIPD
jgi:hypothetical protein